MTNEKPHMNIVKSNLLRSGKSNAVFEKVADVHV